MEIAINRKGVKWLETLKAHLTEAEEEMLDEVEDEAPVCEHFAYKRTLLFYSEECRCCRYAQRMTDAAGDTSYVCKCAAASSEHQAG